MDFSGRPPAVLKTAGLPSTGVHRGPLQVRSRPSDSRIVRASPQMSVNLAVILAVSGTRDPTPMTVREALGLALRPCRSLAESHQLSCLSASVCPGAIMTSILPDD